MSEERVPNDWVRAIIVPLYKGKGDRNECKNYRGISLLSIPGKVYGRIVIERVRVLTEGMIGDEQCGFRSGRGCVDQVFVMKQMSEKFCGKNKSLYVAYMDLEKAYDRIDRDACARARGAKDLCIVCNYSRVTTDIVIDKDTFVKEEQAVPDLGFSSKCM